MRHLLPVICVLLLPAALSAQSAPSLPGRSHFESVLHEPLETLCFVCGPATLVSESVVTLKALGVPDALIRTEGWGR